MSTEQTSLPSSAADGSSAAVGDRSSTSGSRDSVSFERSLAAARGRGPQTDDGDVDGDAGQRFGTPEFRAVPGDDDGDEVAVAPARRVGNAAADGSFMLPPAAAIGPAAPAVDARAGSVDLGQLAAWIEQIAAAKTPDGSEHHFRLSSAGWPLIGMVLRQSEGTLSVMLQAPGYACAQLDARRSELRRRLQARGYDVDEISVGPDDATWAHLSQR